MNNCDCMKNPRSLKGHWNYHDHYGTWETCPSNIYEGGTYTVMSPPNILEGLSFRVGAFYPVTATTVVCCILMQILCVVSRKKTVSGGRLHPADTLPVPGLRPWTPLMDFHPPDSPVFCYVPTNNPVRLTSLLINIAPLRHFRHTTTQKRLASGGFAPWPGALPLDPAGGTAPRAPL